MTATANIQIGRNTAIHKIREDGTMNYGIDNIKMVTRLSNPFGTVKISKLIFGAILGLAMTIGVAMPGAARAEVPPASGPSSSLVNNLNDDFSMVYGIPDSGLELSGADTSAPAKVKYNPGSVLWNDDFSLVYGVPDAGLELSGASTRAPAKLKVYTESLILNDDFSMIFGIPDNDGFIATPYLAKVVRSSTSLDWFDMDLLDEGSYDAKVVRSSTSLDWFDMDLLDEGSYDAKVVHSSTSLDWFDMDLLDAGSYDAKFGQVDSDFDAYLDARDILNSQTGLTFTPKVGPVDSNFDAYVDARDILLG